jgi:hypothetical protein
MKKPRIAFDYRTMSWKRLPAEATGKDLLIAAGMLFIVAIVISIVSWIYL